jgi:Ser/Thr protein kinase RdoA (MazF antagonist)
VYRDIFGAFKNKGGSRDGFYEEANSNSGLDGKRESVNRLLDAIRALETTLEDIERNGGLPSTLIHGDVHYDNTLVDEVTGEVTGILDFEFASYDWAFMEAAAGLSKYVGEPDPTPYVKDYIRGFVLESNPTEAEIKALPDLIKLRVLETVVYFVARSWAGEDDISQLALRAENYAARVAWIDANADVIRNTMREAIAAK